MAILVELQADLAKEFGQSGGRPSCAIQVPSSHPRVERFARLADCAHARPQDRSQAELVLARQAANEAQHISVELQVIAARQGLQDVRIDQRPQDCASGLGIQLWRYLADAAQHLLAAQGRVLARHAHEQLHHIPVVVEGQDERAGVGHLAAIDVARRSTWAQLACSEPVVDDHTGPRDGAGG